MAVHRILNAFACGGLAICLLVGCGARAAKSASSSDHRPGTTPKESALPDVSVQPEAIAQLRLRPSGVVRVAATGVRGLATDGTALYVLEDHGLLALDTDSERVLWRRPLNHPATAVAAGFGSAWLGDFRRNEVRRFDASAGTLQATISVPDNPTRIVAAGRRVWVGQHRGGTLARIDPHTNQLVGRTKVGTSGTAGPTEVASAGSAVYVSVPTDSSVVKVDARTGKVLRSLHVPQGSAVPCGALTIDGATVWVTGCLESDWVSRLDFDTGTVANVGPLGAFAGNGVVRPGAVWLTAYYKGAAHGTSSISGLTAFDRRSGKVLGRARFPGGGYDAVVVRNALWVAGLDSGVLTRFDLSDLDAALP